MLLLILMILMLSLLMNLAPVFFLLVEFFCTLFSNGLGVKELQLHIIQRMMCMTALVFLDQPCQLSLIGGLYIVL